MRPPVDPPAHPPRPRPRSPAGPGPWVGGLSVLFLLACGGAAAPGPPASPPPAVRTAAAPATPSPGERQRGLCRVGGGPVTAEHLAAAADTNATWISQTPFGWQPDPRTPSLSLVTSDRIYWGEQDRGLRETTRLAHEAGLKVVLKPHIWMHGSWRGEIAMETPADWRTWFTQYRRFILHYARLAEEAGIELFCVGTELGRTTGREREWREIIAAVREAYSGSLVYAANWNREFEMVPFWDALDYIGVQAYFPLSRRPSPRLEELKQGWAEPLERLAAVAKRWDRPILLTEVGYRSTRDAAIRPWEWESAAGTDPDLQARCYQALFETVWTQPWCAGVYFWKWFPDLAVVRKGWEDAQFTPQGKPAQAVLARGFARPASPP